MSVPAGNLSRILVTGTSLTQTGVPSATGKAAPVASPISCARR